MDATTVCYACGRGYGPERKHCDCGEPVWFESDASEFSWPPAREQGMWPYADLLPVEVPDDLGAAAGGTPLVRAARLDDYAGCTVHLKDETENPTGTFKDRGSAVAVAATRERGTEWIGTVSHGNMAMSTAAHAAAAGLDCAVFVPEDISAARLAAIGQYGPEIVRVRGDYGRLYRETLAADAPGIEFVNSDTPLRVAGQKTVTYEICERFAPDAPDALALPVSSGGQASAVWLALRELRAAGLLDELPRLYLAQATACDPIARAFREDTDEVTPVEGGETIAYSIANADPPSGSRALAAVRETGGAVVAVPDDEIRDAQAELARRAGLCVEPASATALAGLARLSGRGELAPDDEVAVIATGTGFGELDAASDERGRVADVADLRATLADLVGESQTGAQK
jgi:threonine synthase